MSKRGHGEGSIFRKDNGRWVAEISAGYDARGKRIRRKKTSPTQAEARASLREMQREIEDGLPASRAAMTLAELLDHFATTVLDSKERSPKTIENHQWAIGHLETGLGRAKLKNLSVSDVESFLSDVGARHNLSRSSLGRLRGMLARAIKEAQRREWVHRNVADLAHVPKAHTTTRSAMTREQIADLLDAAKGHRLEAAIKLALTRGLRPGELLGLRWQDLQLDADPPVVKITSSMKRNGSQLSLGGLKTPSSRRDLVLPQVVVEDLKRHRRQQAKQRLRVGEAWNDLDFVFPNEIGGLWDPNNFRREFKELCRDAGIGEWTPYELRHTAVSLLSEGGVPIEQLADLAGHKDARTTMAVYRHKLSSVVEAGADIAEELLASRQKVI